MGTQPVQMPSRQHAGNELFARAREHGAGGELARTRSMRPFARAKNCQRASGLVDEVPMI